MDGNQSYDWTKQTRLRKRSTKNYCYFEESEDECDMTFQYSYSIVDKMKEKRFLINDGTVLHLENGRNFNLQYLQSNGFAHPMVFHDTAGLDIKIPSQSFTVSDVKNLIGPSRIVDVMDCSSQEALTMPLDQFCQYYEEFEAGKDSRLLNVISLEFSHTHLDPLVEAPKVVRQLDWVNLVWPKEMRESQTDPTNDMRRMMYPKVQKYCLMSVAGCYTDFHLDFGGTSVWYHVLKGEKVFFLVPPSQAAYKLFEQWQKYGQQEKTFFPDLVEKCTLVHLKEGDTLLLPSGWIHGVYTPKQSLVFGGNFLNSFHITSQLEVSMMEKQLKVQGKFCYPFFSRIHWHVIEKYSESLTELANAKEPDFKRSCRVDDFSYPPGKWVESVTLSKFPVDKFRLKPMSFEKDTLQLPHISPAEREGLNNLIQKMKGGLFMSDAPKELGNPHSLLSLLETQLHLRTLCSNQPNGIMLLCMGLEKQFTPSCKLEDRRHELAKQGDSEVINIIEEFFGGEEGGGGGNNGGRENEEESKDANCSSSTCSTGTPAGGGVFENNGGGVVGHMSDVQSMFTKQTAVLEHLNHTHQGLDHTQQQLNQGLEQQQHHRLSHVQQRLDHGQLCLNHTQQGLDQQRLDHTQQQQHLSHGQQHSNHHGSSQQQLDHSHLDDNSKLIEELMQNTFGEKSVEMEAQENDDHVTTSFNLLSELTTDQMMQFLTPITSEPRSIAQHSTSDHMTSTSDHISQALNSRLVSAGDHMTSTNDHMTPTTNSMTSIPTLTPDHMTQLLDHVSLFLPGLTNKNNSDDDSLSKIVSSSLDLLSPVSTSPHSVFSASFTSNLSIVTPTPSISSLTTPPNTLSLTNQVDTTLASLNPSNQDSSILHSTGQLSNSSHYRPLAQNTPAKPSSLPITPSSSGSIGISLATSTDPSPSTQYAPKEVKRRSSKSGTRKPRNGSKTPTKKPASRKSRCGKCEGCKRNPCGECKFCLDSVRMGGFGKLKKACIQRRCSNMVEPKNSLSSDSPIDLTPQISCHKELHLMPKKELVKTAKRKGSLSSIAVTPSLDNNDPTVEVLSMGFASSGGGVESCSSAEELMLHPESFGLNVPDDLNTGGSSMVGAATESVTSSNSRESPLMRMNEAFCQEDPLFNTSSISAIHAQVLSSPTTVDLFPFSSHSSESDFTLHLTEDNV